ncbi:hypothetical protein DTO169E5_8872 [Paecilomyces variotii]|nr:hypothetical protein DTO169E5_8872 [Paecilomyces variotii]
MAIIPIDVTIEKACLVFLFCFLAHWVWKVLASPLNSIPGPFLAKWTNLWRLFDVWGGRCELTQKLLHEKYGPVVRLGPNMVSLGDPALIATLYGINGDWLKTDFYHSNSVFQDGKIIYTLFSETDNVRHAQMKRPIAQLYSQNGLRDLEPHINNTISYFIQRLDQEFIMGRNKDGICDLATWLSYYAWDVVGEVTFSTPFGFLEKATDIGNTIMVSERALDYFAVVGQIPFLDFILDKNPIVRAMDRAFQLGRLGFNFITDMTINCLQERRSGSKCHSASNPDFLDKFLEEQKKHPDTVDDGRVVSYLLINMIAGADTTAITLRSVFYYILKNPQVYRQLQEEIDASKLSTPVSYKDARALPYLDAVIREAMRMHPGVGMPLERYVPESGLSANGHYIPKGVKVGINPWVTSSNRDVLGPDAEVFRPDRWLQQVDETDANYETRRKRMNRSDLAFGAGSRVCIGKNLALLEIYKTVATFVLAFHMQLADPQQEWKIQNSWFVRQEGINVRLSPRKN